MNRRIRQSCAVVLAQALCVATGLWMQHWHSAASIRDVLEHQAWGRLEHQAHDLARRLAAARPSWDDASVPSSLLAASLDGVPPDVVVAVVDAKWRVRGTMAADGSPSPPEAKIGAVLAWAPEGSVSDQRSGPQRGTLALSDGRHLAVSCAIDGGDQVVVHRPVTAIESQLASLVGSLSGIASVTFLWLSALLGMTWFVIDGRMQERAEKERAQSTAELLRHVHELVRTRDAVVLGLASLADTRDEDTGEHLERICAYTTILANALRSQPRYAERVTPAFVRLIGISAALHDVGKVAIGDHILRKPGPLTDAEREEMTRHTLVGGQCLRRIEQRLGSSNFLQMAREIALSHHEHWDGNGYPHGLAGDDIPLAARIVAIADVYDALSARRVYKEPLPHDECMAMIRAESGTHFDPGLIEVLLSVQGQFETVALRYADPHVAPDPRANMDLLIPAARESGRRLPPRGKGGAANETIAELAALR